MLRSILVGTRVHVKHVPYFSQVNCTESSYKARKLDKPFFLKELATLLCSNVIQSLDYVLLIDDSPLENIANHPCNAIHPQTWSGEVGDSFLMGSLRTWLEGLLASKRPVPEYVKANPLKGSQMPADRTGGLRLNILMGVP